MEFGCQLPSSGEAATPDNLTRVAENMEEAGFSSIWVGDHIAIPWVTRSSYLFLGRKYEIPPETPFLEPLSALSFVAARTAKIRLGTSVLVLPHRHPLFLAKALATLDVLSKGRLIVGLGIGWLREEIESFGVPFELRAAWSDEAIQLLSECWRTDHLNFAGKYFSCRDVNLSPKPRQSSLPLWIGGQSHAALRRAARLGTGWHPATNSFDELSGGIELLRAECERVGRNFEDITLSLRALFQISKTSDMGDALLFGPVERIIQDCRRLREIGISHVVLESACPTFELRFEASIFFATHILPHV
jgi:probable F420-dependent oxidoreductase